MRLILIVIFLMAFAPCVQALSSTGASPCYAEEGVCSEGGLNLNAHQCNADYTLLVIHVTDGVYGK